MTSHGRVQGERGAHLCLELVDDPNEGSRVATTQSVVGQPKVDVREGCQDIRCGVGVEDRDRRYRLLKVEAKNERVSSQRCEVVRADS